MDKEILLISSPSCSCCIGYYEQLKGVFKKVRLIDASSMYGRVLISEFDIKGLPATIYNGKSISGNINPETLKKLLNYDTENIDSDNSVSSIV